MISEFGYKSLVAEYMVQCSKKTTELGLARLTSAKNTYLTMDYRNFCCSN